MTVFSENFRRIGMVLNRYPVATSILALFIFLLTVPGLMQDMVIGILGRDRSHIVAPPEGIMGTKARLEKELKESERKLVKFTPHSHYLVVNSSANRFVLFRGGMEVWSGKCSTGSYILLKNREEQQWMFKTPKGEFRIQGKIVNPVWKKPDWAFVEEGFPVPAANHPTRYEYGVLGDYALSLGDGYLIHGTLFQRYMGLPVTHGCIRLGDRDLEIVYHALDYGSKVFIY